MRFFYFLLLLLFSGCQTSPQTRDQSDFDKWVKKNGRPKVLCTIEMINDIVKKIAGEHVDTITLIQGDLDPHSYELVKGDDEKLAYADIIFANGLGLEHGASIHHALHKGSKTVFVAEVIDEKDRIYEEGQLDPHVWMDVSLWSQVIEPIVQALSAADPNHAESYASQGEAFGKTMQSFHDQLRTLMLAIPSEKRYLVTSHDAFNYFTKAYLAEDSELMNGEWEKRFEAPEGLSPESQLSLADISRLIDHLNTYDIQVIFPETNVSRDSLRKIVSAGNDKGLDVKIATRALYGDAMGPPPTMGSNYLGMLQHNGETIAFYLNKED